MKMDFVTLFPDMFSGVFSESILHRAMDKGLIEVSFTQLRDFAFDKFRQVDDTPFGGGSGMVLKPEPMFRAVRKILSNSGDSKRECTRIILMSPEGRVFSQDIAKELARYDHLIFLCGHYEGFDARITTYLADDIISIGDYVLTGGELPAMVVADAVARMIPCVLGAEDSATTDSFYDGLLSHPQYTKPRTFEGMDVPEVLLSGNHEKIRLWRRREALRRTKSRRPDLLREYPLSREDVKLLEEAEES